MALGLLGGLAGGGLFGNVFLAALGIGINLAISYFFPQKVKGPRAEDLDTQTSKYGDTLARGYGSYRTAGAVIWVKGNKVREKKRTSRAGKGGGPEVTEYSYSVTCAIAFAWDGPYDAMPRIWADNKLIYDKSVGTLDEAISTGSGLQKIAKGASIEIYLGEDYQDADPTIEAEKGAGNVPAWPGLAYFVIEDLPLDEFGIRVPNFEAELVKNGTQAYRELDLIPSPGPTTTTTGNDFWNWDCYGSYMLRNNHFDTGPTDAQEGVWQLPNGEFRALTRTVDNDRGCILDNLGNAIMTDETQFEVFDCATGIKTQLLNRVGGSTGTSVGLNIMTNYSVGGVSYIIELSIDFPTKFRYTRWANSGSGWAESSYISINGSSIFWSGWPEECWGCSMGPDYCYYILNNSAAGGAQKSIGVLDWSALAEVRQVTPKPGSNIAVVHYCPDNDVVVVVTTGGIVQKWNPEMTTKIDEVDLSSTLNETIRRGVRRNYLRTNVMGIIASSAEQVWELRVSDLSIIATYTEAASGGNWTSRNPVVSIYPSFNSTYEGVALFQHLSFTFFRFLPRVDRGAQLLSEIIQAECRHAGLEPDVSLITSSYDVKGYAIRQATPPRGVLEDLGRVNFFDWCQVDGSIRFFPRQTSAARILTGDDRGYALNAEPDPVAVKEKYAAVQDIPEQVVLKYQSWDAIYRHSAQHSNKEDDKGWPDEPVEVDEGGNNIRLRKARNLEYETAQIMTDDEAAQAADIMHNELRFIGDLYEANLAIDNIDLYPGLVVTLRIDDNRTADVVITKMAGDYMLECEFRSRGVSYSSSAVGMATPYVEDSLLDKADVTPMLIDGHLLQSSDDDDSFYIGVGQTSTGEAVSAYIYRSEDGGSNYNPYAAFAAMSTRALAADALPDVAHPWAIDRATEFTIAIADGDAVAPDSVTEEELLASSTSNAFAVYNSTVGDWEYIRAATVTDNGDGTWTLSTLLRGLKGTDNAIPGHAIGDVVWQLDSTVMARAPEGDRTLSRIYVAVNSGTLFDSTGAVTFTNNGKGLRPWAPVDIQAEEVSSSPAGDIQITFNRRDRLGQEWPDDGAETPPMSEDTESYNLNIYDGSWVLLNTYTATSESFTYTAAQQLTDFGSPIPSSINIGIAQVSATYGEGVERRATI